MEIRSLKKALPYLLKARISTFVWGKHGIGKSQAVKQFCEENNYLYKDIRLGNLEVGDLLGLADFEKDSKGRSVATNFVTPDWIKEIITYCRENPNSKAIIFLDEINRARRDVLQAVFQLALDNRHHTTVLPDNCHVIAASNPNTDGYIVADIGDKAFMDRFCHIKMTPSRKEWLDYAREKNFDRNLVNFIQTQTDMLEEGSVDFQMDEVMPSRRSWEAVNRLIAVGTPEDVLQEVAFGLVGKPATIAFMESMKQVDKPLTVKDVLTNFSKVEDKIKEYSDAKTGGRGDLLKATNEELKKHLENSKKLKQKEADNLIKYLKTIPVDLSFALCRDIYIFDSVREHLDADDSLAKVYESNPTAVSEAKKAAETAKSA